MNNHDPSQKQRAIDLKLRIFIVTAMNELIDSELGGIGKHVEAGEHLSGKLRADLDRLLEEAPWIKDDEDYCAIHGDDSELPSVIAILKKWMAPWIKDDEDYCAIHGDDSELPSAIAVLKKYETAPDNPNCFSPDGEFVD